MRKIAAITGLLLAGVLSLHLVGVRVIPFPEGRLVQRDPFHGRGMEFNEQGVRELAEGRNDRAVATLRTAVGLEPGNPVIVRNLSIALARAAFEEGRSEGEAVGLLRESLALWPENPEGLDGMSTIHFRKARYGEALEYAERLRKILPARPDLDAFVGYLKERASLVEGMVTEEGDRFRLLYSEERRLEYEGEILSVLQTEMDAVTAALGIFPEDPVDVLILTGDLGGRSDPFLPLVEGVYDGQIRLYAGDGIGDREKFIGTVRHEMVHALLHRVSRDLPGWVHEGVAQKLGENPSEERIRNARRFVRRALDQGYSVNLESLEASFITLEGEERARAYAASLLFMDWLEKQFGESFIPRFVSEISNGADSFSAVGKVTGIPFERIQGSFMEYLSGDP